MQIDDNSVWLRNQNRSIPDDDGLYIVVGIVDSHPYSNITEFATVTIGSETTYQQQQRVTVQENVQVDVFSRDIKAAQRNWEVLAALHSLFSQQTQEQNSFKIFRIPTTMSDISTQEGGRYINRYTAIIPVHAWYYKTKNLPQNGGDYYDDFTQRVDDNKSITEPEGIIEFTIDSTGVHN